MSTPASSLGPCQSWASAADVAACCTVGVGSDTELFEFAAGEASMILFELTGRQFTGLCGPIVVRPCSERCGCWGAGREGFWWWSPDGLLGWRHEECGDRCGCRPLSTVKFSGYPVREIVEVKIDGAVVDPSGYRLDGHRKLVRMDDPGPPVAHRRWPGCQNLALEDDQPGTFSVSYTYGAEPPLGAVRAAAALGCQLVSSCVGADCAIPQGATKVTRQGVVVERRLLFELLGSGKSGIVAVDMFMQAFGRSGRKPAVWSPDVQAYAREVG